MRIEESFNEDNPPELIAANERLLKAMGMFPEDASLSGLYLELLGSQVAGFYSPEDDELYVVSRTGGLGPSERVTFAHEYTHAVVDHTANLSSDESGSLNESLADTFAEFVFPSMPSWNWAPLSTRNSSPGFRWRLVASVTR